MSPSANSISDEVISFGAAVTDFVLAAVGVATVVWLPIFVLNDLLGVLSPMQERFAVAVLAFGGSYLFVTGSWSLRRLGAFVLDLFVAIFAVAFVAFVPLGLVGGVPTDSGLVKWLQVGVTAAAYAIACWWVSADAG